MLFQVVYSREQFRCIREILSIDTNILSRIDLEVSYQGQVVCFSISPHMRTGSVP